MTCPSSCSFPSFHHLSHPPPPDTGHMRVPSRRECRKARGEPISGRSARRAKARSTASMNARGYDRVVTGDRVAWPVKSSQRTALNIRRSSLEPIRRALRTDSGAKRLEEFGRRFAVAVVLQGGEQFSPQLLLGLTLLVLLEGTDLHDNAEKLSLASHSCSLPEQQR